MTSDPAPAGPISLPAADAGGPIAWRSLHETVTARLRDLIVEGHLPEGTRIIEKQLCEKLQVSRTPLREAFKVLAVEGLIEIQPNRGAIVSRIGAREARDMLTVISRMEALAGELACANATDAEIAGVRAMHDRMMDLFAKRERMLYFGVNQSIHLEIVRIARNDVLRAMHAQLHARMKRIRFRGNDIPHNWAAAVADHEKIIAALEARDGPRLGALLQRHLDDSWDRLAASLAIDSRAESLSRVAIMSERIGFVGLGLMGTGFTKRLIATGHAVTGYDPDPARMSAAGKNGVKAAVSAAEVAKAVRHRSGLRDQHGRGRGRGDRAARRDRRGQYRRQDRGRSFDRRDQDDVARRRAAAAGRRRFSWTRPSRAVPARPRPARSPSWPAAPTPRSRASGP